MRIDNFDVTEFFSMQIWIVFSRHDSTLQLMHALVPCGDRMGSRLSPGARRVRRLLIQLRYTEDWRTLGFLGLLGALFFVQWTGILSTAAIIPVHANFGWRERSGLSCFSALFSLERPKTHSAEERRNMIAAHATSAIGRLRAQLPFKLISTLLLYPAVYGPYHFLQLHHFITPTELRPDRVDQWIPFDDRFVWIYLSIYLLMPIGPLLMNTAEQLLRYAAGILVISLLADTVFAFYPTICPRPNPISKKRSRSLGTD